MSKYSKKSAEFAAGALLIGSRIPFCIAAFAILDVLTVRQTGVYLIKQVPFLFVVASIMFGFGAVLKMLLRIDEALRKNDPE